jgi:hypothetical protein
MARKASKQAPTKKAPRSKSATSKSATSKSATKRAPAKRAVAKPTPDNPASVAQASDPGGTPGFELDVRVADVEPEIWRRLWVPATTELCDLHLALQLAFDWENSHQHQFSIGVRSYAPEGTPDTQDYDGLQLSALVAPGSKIVYEYDFGDGWEHVIKVVKSLTIPAGDPRFRCLDGAQRGPIEDSGGPPGYMMLLDDLADPSSEQHAEAVELAGEDFDPSRFDRARTNSALAELDRRLLAIDSGVRNAGFDATPVGATGDNLVLMFETGEGPDLKTIQLPDIIVKADAAMLEKLASFFSVAARAVREHGQDTPDIHLSDFLRDDEERANIIVTQDW